MVFTETLAGAGGSGCEHRVRVRAQVECESLVGERLRMTVGVRWLWAQGPGFLSSIKGLW